MYEEPDGIMSYIGQQKPYTISGKIIRITLFDIKFKFKILAIDYYSMGSL